MTFLTGENHASPASEADLDLNSSLGPPPRRSSRLNTSSRSSTPSRTEQAKQGPGTRRTQKIPTKPKFTSIKDNDKEDDDAIGESSCRSSRSQNSRKRKVVNAKESPVPTRKSARTGAARSAQAVDDIREFGRDIVSHTALAHSKIACDEMQIESPGAIPASYKPLTHPEEDRFENDEDDLDATLLLDPSRMMWERSKTPDLPAETEEPKTPKTPGRMGRAKKPPKVTGKPAVCLNKSDNDSDNGFDNRDKSLRIPGEAVLARAHEDDHFYPALVESYNPKNDKYKLTFSSGHCRSLRRQDFHTPFEPVFKEVELGNIAPCEYDNGTPSPAYEDPGLEREIHRALPQIRRLANDIPIKDHRRCQMFFQKAGGIKELEAQLCYGPFDIQQADLIARTLMKEVFGIAVHYSQSDGDEAIAEEKLVIDRVTGQEKTGRGDGTAPNLPDGKAMHDIEHETSQISSGRLPSPPLSQIQPHDLTALSSLSQPSPTSKNDISAIAAQTAAALLHPSASSSPMPSASTPKTDKFTRLVLVPETIIQILMHRNSPEITYAAAEREMHLASRKLRMDYVTEILTARQCAELGESVRKQSRTMG